jgi:hypothetical protein
MAEKEQQKTMMKGLIVITHRSGSSNLSVVTAIVEA